MPFTAKEVMQASAAMLNDAAQSVFTSAAQMPFLNMAMNELQELFEENNIPVTNKEVTDLPVAAGVTEIGFTGGPPQLPADLIEIQEVYEKWTSSNYDWALMTRKTFLPVNQVPTSQMLFYSWIGQVLKVCESNNDNLIRIHYVGSIFAPVLNENDILKVINAKTFLEYRTAALCAEFIGENPTRAESLNTMAMLAIQRALNINVKGTQLVGTRRRPFMMGYRRGGGGYGRGLV